MPEVLAVVLIGNLTVGTVVGYIAFAVASYAVTALLSPSPPSARTPRTELAQQTLSDVDPAAPWQVVYGTTRKGGNYVFRHARNAEAESVEIFTVPLTGPAVITVSGSGSFISHTRVEFRTEGGTGDWYAETLDWTQSGGVYTFEDTWRGQPVRITYRAYNGVARLLHLVLVLAAHPVESIDTIYLGDEAVEFEADGNAIGSYAGYLKCFKHLGTPGEPADAALRAALPDLWTSAHTLEGQAYVVLQLSKGGPFSPWDQGIPNFSAVVQGKNDIFDPRTSTYGYTNNAALIIADYLANPLWGMNAPHGSKINTADLIAAANICDEDVALKAGGTEPRYTINGVISTASLPRDVLPKLVAAMAGRCVYVAGQWRIHAGAYTAPVLTITDSHLRDAMRVTTRLSRREVFNGIKGTYLSPANKWQPADFPAVISNTYIAEDGEPIYKDVELPFTNSASMAQRLAKIDLLRARQQITAELPLKLSAYQAQPPDTVSLTFPVFGWSGKVFELAELKMGFGVAPGVDYVARETSASIFDWDTNEELTADPAPNTTLASPFTVQRPGAPVVVESIQSSFGQAARVRASITWAPSPDAQAQHYVLQWRRETDTVWQERSGLSTAAYELLDVNAVRYYFRVSALNAIGLRSDWSSSDYTFMGLTAPPADVTGFFVTKTGGTAYGTWDAAVDSDVTFGGALVVRHTPDLITPVWEDGIIYDTFAGNSVSGILPLVTGTYMAKWRDAQGKYSNTPALFAVTEGMLGAFTTVATSTQASGFTGSKTNITLDGGLGGIRITTVAGTGEYLFDTHMDLTTVSTRRFEADIVTSSYATDLLFDSDELFDSTEDFDGIENINTCDATLFGRATVDDPAGSPTWGPWTPFFVGEFTCRAMQFKLVLTSTSSANNIVCTTLTVHAKVPV